MAKLERDSLRVNEFAFSESNEGLLTVSQLNVTAVEQETNDNITYLLSDLTDDQKTILANEITIKIKDYIRFLHMTQ